MTDTRQYSLHSYVKPQVIAVISGEQDVWSPSTMRACGYHQEVADIPYARSITGLPDHVINTSLVGWAISILFWSPVSYAVLNTVSENYARELQETESDAVDRVAGP